MKPPKLTAKDIEVIGKIADAAMAYKPKSKTKPARKRARRAKKIAAIAEN